MSVLVPSICLPSTNTLAVAVTASGLISTTSWVGLIAGSALPAVEPAAALPAVPAFEPAAATADPAFGAFLSGILTLGLAIDSGVNESSTHLTPLLFGGSADALCLPVPRPNSRPQNTPIASPAETTT